MIEWTTRYSWRYPRGPRQQKQPLDIIKILPLPISNESLNAHLDRDSHERYFPGHQVQHIYERLNTPYDYNILLNKHEVATLAHIYSHLVVRHKEEPSRLPFINSANPIHNHVMDLEGAPSIVGDVLKERDRVSSAALQANQHYIKTINAFGMTSPELNYLVRYDRRSDWRGTRPLGFSHEFVNLIAPYENLRKSIAIHPNNRTAQRFLIGMQSDAINRRGGDNFFNRLIENPEEFSVPESDKPVLRHYGEMNKRFGSLSMVLKSEEHGATSDELRDVHRRGIPIFWYASQRGWRRKPKSHEATVDKWNSLSPEKRKYHRYNSFQGMEGSYVGLFKGADIPEDQRDSNYWKD